MKLGAMYEFLVKKGLEHDPRTPRQMREALGERRKMYRGLKKRERRAYDAWSLKHPYDDTRILYGDPATEVKTVMVGIDMEAPELMLADRLNQKGEGIDLVMGHHPEGRAWASFYNVMYMQQDIFEKFGIPLKVGKDLLKERVGEVERRVSAANHFRSVDVARLLHIPYMCVHTPADNHVTTYLQRLFEKKAPRLLSNVLDVLLGIPEYADGLKKGTGPHILIGDPKRKAGRIFVDMTGGTEGPKRVFPRLSQAGVGTIVGMHLDEDHYAIAKNEHINVVIAGHIASDTLGLNLILDSLLKKEALRIIPCSGFVRVKRKEGLGR